MTPSARIWHAVCTASDWTMFNPQPDRHAQCDCLAAQNDVALARADMARAREHLGTVLRRLTRVIEETSQPMTETIQAVEATTAEDQLALAHQALELAGRQNAGQAELIRELKTALHATAVEIREVRNEVADWQQRYQSVADRLAENWPPNAEVARLQLWVQDLAATVRATQTALEEQQAETARWRAAAQALPLVATETDGMLS